MRTRTSTSLTFYPDDLEARGALRLTLWLVSDSYLGLDQCYDIPLTVAEDTESSDEAGSDSEEEDGYGGDGDEEQDGYGGDGDEEDEQGEWQHESSL